MSHIRTLIRQKLINLLSGNTIAGSNVFDSRLDSFKDECPALSIFTVGERMADRRKRGAQHSREIIIECSVMAAVATKDHDNWATELDDLCLEVESLIPGALYTATGELICGEFLYAGTEISVPDKVTGETVATANIKYEAKLEYEEGGLASEDDLDDLNTIATDWDMIDHTVTGEPGPDGQIDASDLIDLTP